MGNATFYGQHGQRGCDACDGGNDGGLNVFAGGNRGGISLYSSYNRGDVGINVCENGRDHGADLKTALSLYWVLLDLLLTIGFPDFTMLWLVHDAVRCKLHDGDDISRVSASVRHGQCRRDRRRCGCHNVHHLPHKVECFVCCSIEFVTTSCCVAVTAWVGTR